LGVGLFNSRLKYRFLPFAESDFILSVIGEELGFIGTAIVFLVLLFLCYRGVKVAVKSKNMYAYLLSVGITTIFIIQVFINALVVTGSIPPTGLPLPLISCGNTSLIVFMTAFGLLYNVSKDVEKI
jgi:cell division protein FtsW